MLTKVLDIMPLYSDFELPLPEELTNDRKSILKNARRRFNEIQKSDLSTIKNILESIPVKKNKGIKFKKFENDAHYVIKMGFENKNEKTISSPSFFFAHWYMSKAVIDEISAILIQLYDNLLELHNENINDSKNRINYFNYVRGYQDFYGYLISMRNLINQYHDNFVILCKSIDSSIKENPIIAFTSDTFTFEFFQATRELLLRGNEGRLAGFPLLRSAAEVGIFGALFDLRSNKINNRSIVLKERIHLDDICRIIEKKKLNQFQTDTLRRLYDWQSKVSHKGFRTKEYVLWYVYYYVGGIINEFSSNMRQTRGSILEELQREKLIELKPT